MAQLVATALGAPGAVPTTVNTGTVADTFVFKDGGKQNLIIRNGLGVTANVTILGDLATTHACSGIGEPVDVSTGYQLAINAGDAVTINTESIKAYLADADNEPDITSDQAGLLYTLLEG